MRSWPFHWLARSTLDCWATKACWSVNNPHGAAKGRHVFVARGHDLATGTWRRIGRENMAPWLGGSRSGLDEDYQAGRAARVPPGTRTDNLSKTATFVLMFQKRDFAFFATSRLALMTYDDDVALRNMKYLHGRLYRHKFTRTEASDDERRCLSETYGNFSSPLRGRSRGAQGRDHGNGRNHLASRYLQLAEILRGRVDTWAA